MTFDLQFSSLPTTRSIKVLGGKGKGSYGAVFSVELDDGDTNQKKALVCKCLHDILLGINQELEVSQEQRKFIVSKFMKECVLLSNLKHRNIVQFKSVYVGTKGTEFGDIKLVMEALEFDLFSACVRSQMKISYIRKLAILRDISSGLKYLHDAKIIHRDLNAGNILLSKNLVVVKIADFGCSKIIDQAHMMSEPMTTCPGATDFMPPEALDEHNSVYDYKLDCFSFGHLALYLWNQKQPIVSTTVNREDVDQKKQQFARRRPYFKCMENHPDIRNLLSACLADECYDRPSSKEILSFFNKKIGGCISPNLHLSSKTTEISDLNVIAVDFGMLGLRVSYCIGTGQVKCLSLQEEYSDFSIPNVLVIKTNEKTGLTEAEIGYRACNQYQVDCSTTKNVYYQFNSEPLQSLIQGSDGMFYLTSEVIGVILMYVRKKVMNYFSVRKILDIFQWVLTISNTWKDKTQRILKEASCMAGLCGEKNVLNLPLSPVPSDNPQSIVKPISENVCLVLKSDAAAAAVVFEEMQEVYNDNIDSCYMVVDVGKLAVEVSAFVYQNGRYEFLKQPYCGYYEGSGIVNKIFFKYLSLEMLHDEDFQLYFQHKEKAKHNVEFHIDFNKSVEHAKVEFASLADNNSQLYFAIEMPPSFFEVYNNQLDSIDDISSIKLDRRKRTLLISYSKFDEFMSDCFDRTKEAIDSTFEFVATENRTVKAIYLVGGMGASQYMVDKIRSCYDHVDTLVLDQPILATVHGACHYLKENIYQTSKMNYGISCSVPYDDDNDTHQLGEILLSDDEKRYCSSVFIPLLCKTEAIDPLKVHTCVLIPMYREQSVMKVSLYSIEVDPPPNFVLDVDKGSMPYGVIELASLDVNIELGMDSYSLEERQVQVTVRFGIEVVLTAEYNRRNKISKVFMM